MRGDCGAEATRDERGCGGGRGARDAEQKSGRAYAPPRIPLASAGELFTQSVRRPRRAFDARVGHRHLEHVVRKLLCADRRRRARGLRRFGDDPLRCARRGRGRVIPAAAAAATAPAAVSRLQRSPTGKACGERAALAAGRRPSARPTPGRSRQGAVAAAAVRWGAERRAAASRLRTLSALPPHAHVAPLRPVWRSLPHLQTSALRPRSCRSSRSLSASPSLLPPLSRPPPPPPPPPTSLWLQCTYSFRSSARPPAFCSRTSSPA